MTQHPGAVSRDVMVDWPPPLPAARDDSYAAPRHLHAIGSDREMFDRFVRQHQRGLSRLAYLLTGGDSWAADELAAEALLVAWKQWDKLSRQENPLPYVRRTLSNLAASRVRSLVREQRRLRLFRGDTGAISGTDGAAVVDVRKALLQLPPRRRACVVLRHAFDLEESEIARVLGISLGTVKSQTSRGVAQLRVMLGTGGDRV